MPWLPLDGLWQRLQVRLLVPTVQMEVQRNVELRARLIGLTLGHAWIGNSRGIDPLDTIKRRSAHVLCIRGSGVPMAPLPDEP